jgi:ABC-type phosphate transport system substrate-binding protein
MISQWMKQTKAVLFALIAVAAMGSAWQCQAQVLIVANPGVKGASISTRDIRDVFTGVSTSLRDGSHVTPVLLKAGPVQQEFLHLYIGKEDTAFRATWRSFVFSGQGMMPKDLDSDSAIVEYVARTPGAIGYIGKGSPHEGVKVLAVN